MVSSASLPAREILRVEGLRKSFGGRIVLEDIGFSLEAGDIVGIIGRSGAGKTTLLRCLTGEETPDAGRVILNGVCLGGLTGKDLLALRRRIGLVFQNFSLLRSRSVSGNIALALEIAGIDRRRHNSRINELIALVGLDGHENKYPSQLSGGQKQRVGIARALASEPSLLLCDEPTSALDPEATQSIRDLLYRLNDQFGLAILLITHEMEVVRHLARRVLVLDQGRIVEDVAMTELARGNARHSLTRAFLAQDEVSLPKKTQNLMRKERTGQDLPVVRLRLPEDSYGLPLLSILNRDFGVEAVILHASVGERHHIWRSNMTLLLSRYAPEALAWLTEKSVELEVLGYVSSHA